MWYTNDAALTPTFLNPLENLRGCCVVLCLSNTIPVRKSDRWDFGGETFLWMLETACYLSTYLSKSLGK